MFRSYRPVHSDFLVHWTGKDIEKKFNTENWYEKRDSTTSKELTEAYLERLKSILKYGLWMTKATHDSEPNKTQNHNFSWCCFTELRLSEVRLHASRYGRLGLCFKRYFLFDRLGRPVVYYKDSRDLLFSNTTTNPVGAFENELLSCFIKPMSSGVKENPHYDLYDESEWRIIWSDKLNDSLKKKEIYKNCIYHDFWKPNDCEGFKKYLHEIKSQIEPEYLIPL